MKRLLLVFLVLICVGACNAEHGPTSTVGNTPSIPPTVARATETLSAPTLTAVKATEPTLSPALTSVPQTSTVLPPTATHVAQTSTPLSSVLTATPSEQGQVVSLCGFGTQLFFGNEVPMDSRQTIVSAAESSIGFDCTASGTGAEFTLFAYADFDKLVQKYAHWSNTSTANARQRWEEGERQAITISGVIFLNLSKIELSQKHLTAVISHEYFHVLQRKLAGESVIVDPDNQVANIGPRWLTEGAAVYVESLAVENAGLDTFTSLKAKARGFAKTLSVPLRSMESLTGMSRTDGAGYSLGFLACDYLIRPSQTRISGAKSLAQFWGAIGSGKTWQQAFKMIFGKSIDDFYSEFEQYRKEF